MRADGSKRRAAGVAHAALVALALSFGIVAAVVPSMAVAEDNNPNPPPPKPKDPPPDPCANSKMRSACRNAEAVRSLLREPPPMDPKPAADAGAGTAVVK